MGEPDERILAALRKQLSEQRRLIARGARRVGWKVALGIEEVEDRPLIGYLTSATLLEQGTRHSAAGAADLRVDAEIAVVNGVGYAAGLEIVDLGQGRGTVESVIRTNVLHRAVLVAHPPKPSPGDAVRVRVGDEWRAEVCIGFDIDERVEIVRYWLAALGEMLQPGDTVITGSIAQVPVAPGDVVTVELAELGSLVVKITE